MKSKNPIITIFVLILVMTIGNTANANPDIKDEAIKVLLNFKSNCNLQNLSREVTEENGLKFTAECGDKTFYPDGLIVLCPIRDVDVSCKIMTPPKEFKYLNLIYGPMSKRVHASDEIQEE